MQKKSLKKSGGKRIGAVTRKNVNMGTEALVNMRPLVDGQALPYLVEAAVDGINLPEWIAGNQAPANNLLWQHKALLFRGFNIRSPEVFEEFVLAASNSGLLEYVDRTTPRHSEGGKSDRVYISTIYPSEQTIRQHNEGTYWTTWARKIFFCCLTAPDVGGATPLTDTAKVFADIDPAVRQRFIDKDWMLVRNFNDGFGLPWQEVFQTESRDEVENYCDSHAIRYQWKDGDRLRTYSVRPAVYNLPNNSDEKVWFNHAAFYHYTSLDPAVREALMSEYSQEQLPYNTFYGDGSHISPEDAEHIREAYERHKVSFPWQPGDVLMLDNMSIAHGRQPYQGDRKVIVGLTEPVSLKQLIMEQASMEQASMGQASMGQASI
jgi:alpha-ketoglutarate-dependent taurine dioxygenase